MPKTSAAARLAADFTTLPTVRVQAVDLSKVIVHPSLISRLTAVSQAA